MPRTRPALRLPGAAAGLAILLCWNVLTSAQTPAPATRPGGDANPARAAAPPAPAPEQAEEEDGLGPRRAVDIRAGDLRVLPALTVREVYDSNIFLEDDDTNDDWITHLEPEIGLALDTDRLRLSGRYRADVQEYARNEDLSDVEHDGSLSSRYRLDRVSFGAGGSFRRTNSPLNLVLTDRLIIDRQRYFADVGVDFAPLTSTLRASLGEFDIGTSRLDFLNHDVRAIDWSGAYLLDSRLRLLLGASLGQQDYDQRLKNDQFYYEAVGGVGWYTGTEELVGGRLEVGYRRGDYDPQSGSASITDDYDSFVLRAEAGWTPLPYCLLRVAYTHGPEDAVFSNFTTVDRVGGSVNYEFHPRWRVGVSAGYQHVEESNELASQQIKEGVSAGAELAYRILGCLAAEAGYEVDVKSTDDGQGEYRHHQVSFSLRLDF